jgi:hypothetical protein
MPEHIDCSALPIRRPPFSGVVNRTLAGSHPDWGILGSVAAPEGAPNVLVVLIDDAGSAIRARSADLCPRPT